MLFLAFLDYIWRFSVFLRASFNTFVEGLIPPKKLTDSNIEIRFLDKIKDKVKVPLIHLYHPVILVSPCFRGNDHGLRASLPRFKWGRETSTSSKTRIATCFLIHSIQTEDYKGNVSVSTDRAR